MEKVAPTSSRFAALGYRNFKLIWSGLIVSNVGTWMQNVANGWLVLQLTNSPLWLGLLGLSFAVPMIILPPLAGAVVDRVNRIKLLYFTQSMQMLGAFVLAALTWFGTIQVWHILAVSFVSAAMLAFDNPARQALVPDLVAPPDLLNALSLNAATYNGAALVGPALAGVMLAPFGAGTLFFINGVSFLAVIFALTAMRDVRTHSGGDCNILCIKSFWTGLTYAWSNRLIMALLVLSAIGSLFGRSYQTLLPAFSDVWNAGPQGYGLLLASAGGGALVGAFGLAAIRHVSRHGVVMLVNGLLFSFALIGFRTKSIALAWRNPIIYCWSDIHSICYYHCDIHSSDDSQRNARPCDELLHCDIDRFAVAGRVGKRRGCRMAGRDQRRASCGIDHRDFARNYFGIGHARFLGTHYKKRLKR